MVAWNSSKPVSASWWVARIQMRVRRGGTLKMLAAKNITTIKPDQFWITNRTTIMKIGMRKLLQ